MTETESPKILREGKKYKVKQARFSDDSQHLIDSNGQLIDFNNPRIVYVDPEPRNSYGRRLVTNLFRKYNRTLE